MNHSIRHQALLGDLQKLPNWKITLNSYCILGVTKDFYVRVLRCPEKEVFSIEFADKRTFDRWANSVNFTTKLTYTANYRNDLLKGYRWATKVNRSKLFKWNVYFHPIELVWNGLQNR